MKDMLQKIQVRRRYRGEEVAGDIGQAVTRTAGVAGALYDGGKIEQDRTQIRVRSQKRGDEYDARAAQIGDDLHSSGIERINDRPYQALRLVAKCRREAVRLLGMIDVIFE